MIDWLMEKLVMPIIQWIIVISVLIGVPTFIWFLLTNKPPETISLNIDEWQCIYTYNRDREVCTKGCRWVTESVCGRWERKK